MSDFCFEEEAALAGGAAGRNACETAAAPAQGGPGES